MFTTYPLPAEVRADVLGCEVSPSSAHCSGTSKRISRVRSVARAVSSRRRISKGQRSLSSVTSLSLHSAIVELSEFFTQASSSRGASHLVSGRPLSTVRMEQRAFGGILCPLRCEWSLRWLDVCICPDASEKMVAFAIRKDAARWRRKLVEAQGGQG